MKIITDAKELPKAKLANISDDIIIVTIQRQKSADGLIFTNCPIGYQLRVKPSTLQNAVIKDANGVEHNKVIINCYDENGKYLTYMFFELLSISNNANPNKFFNDNKV